MEKQVFEKAADLNADIHYLKRELDYLTDINNIDQISRMINNLKLLVEIPAIDELKDKVKTAIESEIDKLQKEFEQL
jgi:hypothetical protein